MVWGLSFRRQMCAWVPLVIDLIGKKKKKKNKKLLIHFSWLILLQKRKTRVNYRYIKNLRVLQMLADIYARNHIRRQTSSSWGPTGFVCFSLELMAVRYDSLYYFLCSCIVSNSITSKLSWFALLYSSYY